MREDGGTEDRTLLRQVRLALAADILPDGRVGGTVSTETGVAHRFEGWLELLSTLTQMLSAKP